MQKKKTSKKLIFTLGALFTSTTALLILGATAPDLQLQLIREVPSSSNPARLNRNIESLNRWPQWFHSLSKAQIISPSGAKQIEKGSIIALLIDPKHALKKPFQLTAEVTEYLPNRKIQLKILDDSTQRITRILDQMEWTVEVDPTSQGSLIRGIATAYTKNWRSRLLGRMAERTLMNQVFYPDLMKLAELKQPFEVNDGPIVPSPGI